MRFGLIHRIMTDALAGLGLFALIASGKLHLVAAVVTLLGFVVALALPDRFKQQTFVKVAGVVAPLGALGIEAVRLLSGADPIPVVVEFAALLQVSRLITRRGAAHDHQIILLALLHLIAGTVLGGGLTYALSLLGFLVFTPGAMVLSHLRREVEGNYRQGAKDRTGMPVDVPRILRSRRVIGGGFLWLTCLLSVPVFLFTALLFVLFPRVGFSWLMVPPIEPRRVVGFSDRVDLGGVGTIRTDPTLVMRVRPRELSDEPPLRRNLYLRGAVFDTYDGRSWARRGPSGHGPREQAGEYVLRRGSRPGDQVLKIQLEPIEPTVVFLPGEAIGFRVHERNGHQGRRSPPITSGAHGEIRYTSFDQSGIEYDAYLPPRGLVVPEGMYPGDAPRYLALPENVSPRIIQLAQALTQGKTTPVAIARALEDALRTKYTYDLSSPSGAAKDPLVHFLFESKRGHCEFYSTAMAVMLRAQGVPSRNVTGFVGGTYNRFGEFYAVRQGDAHSWVEAYLPDLGWTRFDPTPPSSAGPQGRADGAVSLMREMLEAAAQSWSQNVEGFNLQKQVNLFTGVRGSIREAFSFGRKGRAGSGPSGVRILVLVIGGVAVAGGVVIFLRRKNRPEGPMGAEPSAGALRAKELYRQLERVLAGRGLGRPPGTPPRTHALALTSAGHPLGPDVLSLTDDYLSWRFGGRPLTQADARSYIERLHALKKRQLAPKEAAEPAPNDNAA